MECQGEMEREKSGGRKGEKEKDRRMEKEKGERYCLTGSAYVYAVILK